MAQADTIETGAVLQVQGSRADPDFICDIQIRKAGDGTWQQRHIWHADQIGHHAPPRTEQWIPSLRPSDADLARYQRLPAGPIQ